MTQELPRTYQELRWLEDMDPMAAETTDDLESLEQDVFHILVERTASNLDDLRRGVGIGDYLGQGIAQNGATPTLTALAATIDTQLGDDPRIASAVTTITPLPQSTTNGGVFYAITVAVQVSNALVKLNFVLGPNGLTYSGRS